jgi:hypothetical protein
MTAEFPVKVRSAINSTLSRRRGRLFPFWLALIFGALAAAGCGGGGDDSAAGGGGGGGGGGQSWSVSGTPPASIVAGTAFSFTPTVTNPNNVALTFSITNLPSWATFNTATGGVTGTPSQNDVGTYSNIRLTVSDGTNTYTSPAYTVQVVGTASGGATLTWTAPQTYTDGSNLIVSSYKVYWGSSPGNYPNVRTVPASAGTSYVVTQLSSGTWYFVVTALDSSNVESSFSNMAQKTI